MNATTRTNPIRGVPCIGAFMGNPAGFLATALLLIAGPAQAEPSTLIRDDFQDDNRQRLSPLDLDWRKAHNIGELEILSIEYGALNWERSLKFSGTRQAAVIVGVLEKDTVFGLGPESGDQLELALDFRFLGATTTNIDLRVGLYHDNRTWMEGDGHAAVTDDRGYRVDFRQTGGSCAIGKEWGDGGGVGGGPDKFSIHGATLKSFPPLGTNQHHLRIALTRIPEGIGISVELDGEILRRGLDDGVSLGEGPEQQSLIESFSEILVGSGYPNTQGLVIDNVTVTATPVDEDKTLELTVRSDDKPLPVGQILGMVTAGGLLIACTIFWIWVFIPPRKDD